MVRCRGLAHVIQRGHGRYGGCSRHGRNYNASAGRAAEHDWWQKRKLQGGVLQPSSGRQAASGFWPPVNKPPLPWAGSGPNLWVGPQAFRGRTQTPGHKARPTWALRFSRPETVDFGVWAGPIKLGVGTGVRIKDEGLHKDKTDPTPLTSTLNFFVEALKFVRIPRLHRHSYRVFARVGLRLQWKSMRVCLGLQRRF